jgi:hypothetical protein
MDRSGTSMVAALVSHWGAYGGNPEELQNGDIRNPHGYYENYSLACLIAELFKEIEVGFWHPSFTERLLEKARDLQIREKATQIAAKMGQHSDVWFWKEPYLSVMLPFWNEILEEATYVIPLRNPYDSARSWQKFTLPKEFEGRVSLIAANLLRWHHMLRSVLIGTNHVRHRRIFVSYEDLIQFPREQCQRIADFLDDQYGAIGRPADRVERMVQEIDPSLHRNKSLVPFAEVPEATAEQKAFYEFLLGAVDDPQVEFDAEDFPLYAGWREYLENMDQFTKFHQQVCMNSFSGRVAIALRRISYCVRVLLNSFRRG